MDPSIEKLGVFSLPEGIDSYRAAVDWTAELGLGALELFSEKEFAQPDREAARKVRDHADRRGIALPCLSVFADLTRPGEAERLMRYAELAADIGVGMLHHTIYPSFQPSAADLPFEPLLDSVVPEARRVYDHAASLGVHCVYEDQGFQFNGCERFRRFLEQLDRPAGVVLDVGNIAFVGETAMDFMRAFSERIVHVHLKDFVRSTDSDADGYDLPDGSRLVEVPIGEGPCSPDALCRALLESGYDGWFMYEYDPRRTTASAGPFRPGFAAGR